MTRKIFLSLWTRLVLVGTLALLVSEGLAEDTPLHSPTPEVIRLPEPLPLVIRPNPYDVWQNYGVDRHGHFRARVIYSPSGPYYLYNGQPYPWAMNHPMDIMPYVVD